MNEANPTTAVPEHAAHIRKDRDLDVEACVENLGIFAAQGDARSCSDVGIALANEVRRQADQIGLVRDALRRAGFSLDQVGGDDLAGLIDQLDTDARGLVGSLGAEAKQLRDANERMQPALERIAAIATPLADAAERRKLPTTARLWRGVAQEAANALKED